MSPRIDYILYTSVFFTAIKLKINTILLFLEMMIIFQLYYLRRIIPILDTVAGDACLREWVSKIKFILFPNWILQPEGNVNNLLSSKTEFSDSIHSGSTSPSNIIQEIVSINNNLN